MAQLRSKDVLQIDATIIAGLLILLTLQTSSSNNVVDNISQQITQNNIDYDSSLKLINLLKEKQKTITDQNRYNYFQNQIDSEEIKLYQFQVRGTALLDQQQNMFKNGNSTSYGWSNDVWIKVIAILMAIPFVISAGWEIIETFGTDTTEKASRGSKISMIIGFFILLIGFSQIEKFIING